MISNEDLSQHLHDAVATFAAGLALVYTLGLVAGTFCFGLYDKYTPVLGLVPRRGHYKAPQAAPIVAQVQPTQKPRKRPSRAKKVALATN